MAISTSAERIEQEMREQFTRAFHSKRLIYRAIDETSDSDLHLMTQTLYDPVSQGLADPGLYQPHSESHAKSSMKGAIANGALIAVLVCVPFHPEDEKFLASPSQKAFGKEGTAVKKVQSRADPIGTMMLYKSPKHSTSHVRTARLGAVGIQEEHRGKGYGKEAIRWLVNWGFRWAGLHRIELGVISYNTSAIRLYESVGFKLEGRKRECVFMAGRWFDLLEFGMLEGEWKPEDENQG
ncbi:Acyl-CoA N-acyltransferase [Rhypophila decipiens]